MGFKSLTPQPPEVYKFTLTVGTSGNTTYILDRSYAAGVYTVTFQGGDNTFDIYAIGADGTNVGYTNSGRLTATDKIKEVVVLGAANNEEIIFDNIQVGDAITPTSKGDVASAGAFVTSVDPSSLPSVDDTVTVTGGNFAADVEAYFIDQSANEVAAKTVVRNSSTEIVVTRPDSFSTADSPFTIKVVNPNVTLPTGSSAHLLSNAVTAGTNPVWQTTAAQAYNIGIANTITLVASDTEASDVDYAITAGSLPAGLTLDGETGVISGTPSGGAEGDQTVFTVRATDAGGNFVDREFTFTANTAPAWTTTSSDIGDAGNISISEPLSFQFVADGGTGGGSLTYSVQSGSLPTGTSLSSTGLLTGTPTVEQTATFTLRVTDEAGLFADRQFTVVIQAAFTATGGVTTTDATYTYHTFTSSDTFTANNPEGVNFDVLLVAGGGGGGSPYSGGGGGAGGVFTRYGYSLSSGSYPVTVGLGGAGFNDSNGRIDGDNGEDSVFDIFTAIGGGGGSATGTAKAGGSGGGYHWDAGSGGSSIQTSNNGGTGYGNNGGGSGTASSACGGGGAGTEGQGVNGTGGGAGGDGILLSEWANATSTGADGGYYAGGGGGGGKNGQDGAQGAGGTGGAGGGGNGGGPGAGNAGVPNTGGGGGGADNGATAGAGGSGVVIIRYPTP